MSEKGNRKYDIIVFGATGFSGKYVIKEIVNTIDAEKKLDAVLKEMGDITGKNLSTVDKVISDVSDMESLQKMARQCTVVANLVGPYAYYGEVVIKACIQEGTHHVDISAESHDLTKMQILYNQLAEEKGVYIVGSCGFDSIINECGINFLNQNFEGELNSVESYVYLGPNVWKTKFNYGSWKSILRFYGEFNKLRPLLKTLYPQELPKPKYSIVLIPINFCFCRWWPHHNSVGEVGWCLPFPHPDVWAVEKSQNYFYLNEKQRPIQFGSYLKSNFLLTMVTVIAAILLGILIKCRLMCLLERFPRFFSVNFVAREGPTKAEMEAFDFSVTLVGKGWNTKLENPNQDHPNPPDKTVVAQVKGNNPGYRTTCTCLVQSALVVLNENHLMPSNGGVFTAGTAFSKSTILNRLSKHDSPYRILE